MSNSSGFGMVADGNNGGSCMGGYALKVWEYAEKQAVNEGCGMDAETWLHQYADDITEGSGQFSEAEEAELTQLAKTTAIEKSKEIWAAMGKFDDSIKYVAIGRLILDVRKAQEEQKKPAAAAPTAEAVEETAPAAPAPTPAPKATKRKTTKRKSPSKKTTKKKSKARKPASRKTKSK